MEENPILVFSDKAMQSIFKGAESLPQCVVAFTVKDGRLWMQRRTSNFPVDAFDSVVRLLQEDLDREKNQQKEKIDGNTAKTRRCRTRK